MSSADALAWLFVLGALVHHAEEAAYLPAWSKRLADAGSDRGLRADEARRLPAWSKHIAAAGSDRGLRAEEAPRLPAWSKRFGPMRRPVPTGAFRFAVAALSLLLAAAAAAATLQGPRSLGAYLFSGYVFAMVANVFVPHLAATIALRRCMPGTVTALALNLPLGVLYLARALSRGLVRPGAFAVAAATVTLALAAGIPALLALGGRIWRDAAPSSDRATPT